MSLRNLMIVVVLHHTLSAVWCEWREKHSSTESVVYSVKSHWALSHASLVRSLLFVLSLMAFKVIALTVSIYFLYFNVVTSSLNLTVKLVVWDKMGSVRGWGIQFHSRLCNGTIGHTVPGKFQQIVLFKLTSCFYNICNLVTLYLISGNSMKRFFPFVFIHFIYFILRF